MSESGNITRRVWCTEDTKDRLGEFRCNETWDDALNRLLDAVEADDEI
jgi:hypothetical protein